MNSHDLQVCLLAFASELNPITKLEAYFIMLRLMLSADNAFFFFFFFTN